MEQRNRLGHFRRRVGAEVMRFPLMKFRGPLSEDALDAFADLEFGPSSHGIAIREPFLLQILNLSDLILQFADILIHRFERGGMLGFGAGWILGGGSGHQTMDAAFVGSDSCMGESLAEG
ncbi:MAG: hypothetical protein NW703_14245 [Nitrospiraceae bacterium]